MTSTGQRVWGSVLSTLKSQVSASNYKTWFLGSYVLDYKETSGKNLLIIAVGNNFVKEQIESRFHNSISQIVDGLDLGEVEIVFVVSQKEAKTNASSSPLFSGVADQYVASAKYDALNSNHTFANFMVGSSNNLAYLAASQVCDNLGSVYNPFLAYGPTGVGKTHLLQAIANEVLSKVYDAKVLYATSEKFTNDFLESLKNGTQAAFRGKYRSLNLLIVDDIQFLAGKESTQDEFFHTFNELILAGRQVVLASDRHPKDLGRLKERLVSRFLGGMVADIGLPDIETKMLIVKTKCQERGINLDLPVVEHIARECDGGARELEGILTSVLAHIKLSDSPSSADEIVFAINKGRRAPRDKISSKDVISAVCRHFGISVEDLRGSCRKSRLVFARQIAMYMMRQNLGLSLEKVGDTLGGRDHSTVIHGVDKIDRAIRTNISLRDEVSRVRSLLNI